MMYCAERLVLDASGLSNYGLIPLTTASHHPTFYCNISFVTSSVLGFYGLCDMACVYCMYLVIYISMFLDCDMACIWVIPCQFNKFLDVFPRTPSDCFEIWDSCRTW